MTASLREVNIKYDRVEQYLRQVRAAQTRLTEMDAELTRLAAAIVSIEAEKTALEASHDAAMTQAITANTDASSEVNYIVFAAYIAEHYPPMIAP